MVIVGCGVVARGKGNGPGKPESLQGKTLELFKEGLTYDWSIEKCCNYAGIHPSTYYNWIKRHPEYVDQFSILRQSGLDEAQKFLFKHAQKDANTAKWVLERRRSDKFASQQKVDINHTLSLDNQLLDVIRGYNQIEQDDDSDVIEAEVVDKSLLPDLGN